MPPQRPAISDTEMEVLRLLWDHGPGTVRELMGELKQRRRRWAYTTVQTLLNRLRDKGYVARDESDLAHVFRAAVSRDRLLGWRLRELADQICGGASSALVMNLVQDADLPADELASLRRVLDEADGKPRRRRRKQS
jgi:predicted transcriptional regulator